MLAAWQVKSVRYQDSRPNLLPALDKMYWMWGAQEIVSSNIIPR